jgi:hypothetical protein
MTDMFETVNGVLRAKTPDICERKHGGNPHSTEAHKRIREGLSARRELVYRCIKVCTMGITVDELASQWNEPPNNLSGRFSELARDGRIVKSGTRPTRSNCPAAVWKVKQ